MTDSWKGGAGNWNVSGNWTSGIPASYDTAAAASGTVDVTDSESVGGVSFSGSALLNIDGGALTVGVSQLGSLPPDSFVLGASGAVLTGSGSTLTIADQLSGAASGTVYLEGQNSAFYWEPQLSSYPAPATAANSSDLVVDFADSGNGDQFVVDAQFGGKVASFQAGDSISWSDQDLSTNGKFTATIGNDTVTLTDNKNHSVTINFQGASNQYNSSDISVSSSGVITTTYLPPAPQVGSATYDAATGKLVVNAATGSGAAPFNTGASFDPSQLSLTGEYGFPFALSAGDVVSNVTASSFTVTLSAIDQLQVDGLVNNNGAASTGNEIVAPGSVTYQISANAAFTTGGRASNGGIVVSDALTPRVTGVSFDPSTGLLTLTGTGFEDAGGYGGVNLGQVTLTGGAGKTFTFDAGDWGNAISSTKIVIDLSSVTAYPYPTTTTANPQYLLSGEGAAASALFDEAGLKSAEGTTYNFSAPSGWDSGAGAAITTLAIDVACFTAGARIRTPKGEVAVEDLRIGDLVVTLEGAEKPITWIGRRAVSSRFADPLTAWPIRVSAGALGENSPARNLLLSPDHALLVGGVLIHAGALVNGASIVQVAPVTPTFVYYHVELEDHSLIFAENAPAETFVDTVERMAFDNWAEFEALYPNGRSVEELAQPRAKARRQVPARIRAEIDARAQNRGDSGLDITPPTRGARRGGISAARRSLFRERRPGRPRRPPSNARAGPRRLASAQQSLEPTGFLPKSDARKMARSWFKQSQPASSIGRSAKRSSASGFGSASKAPRVDGAVMVGGADRIAIKPRPEIRVIVRPDRAAGTGGRLDFGRSPKSHASGRPAPVSAHEKAEARFWPVKGRSFARRALNCRVLQGAPSAPTRKSFSRAR